MAVRRAWIDGFDRQILAALQQDGRLTNVQLSERVHLSPSQCQRRVKRLEEAGVIARYVALVDPEAVGLDVSAFVHVSLDRHGEEPARAFAQAIARYPEILECWSVSGEADYLVRITASDLKAFSHFLMNDLLSLPMVSGVRSTIQLETLKSTTALPLPKT